MGRDGRHGGAALGLIVLALLAPGAWAQALDTNLLGDPGFEAGGAGWTLVDCAVLEYGSDVDLPGTDVALALGGGDHLLHSTGAGSASQTVALPAIPAGAVLHVAGHLGGWDDEPDRASLSVRFLDGASDPDVSLGTVTRENRNDETVLLRREALLAIPAGTTAVELTIDFIDELCCGEWSSADEFLVELVDEPLVPAAWPADTELLANGGFEEGWSPGSPLRLDTVATWEGLAGAVVVQGYGDDPDDLPSEAISCLVDGGLPGQSCLPAGAGSLLRGLALNGSVLTQRVDLRGNRDAGDFVGEDALVLRVGAFLGGADEWQDDVQVSVRFLDEDADGLPGGELSGGLVLAPVTYVERNRETLVQWRQADVAIPAATAFVALDLELNDLRCCVEWQLADNVSARLVPPSPPVVHPYGEDLLVNGGFEDGFLEGSPVGSPLTLTDGAGWLGYDRDPDPDDEVVIAGTTEVVAYGIDPDLQGEQAAELLKQVAKHELGGQLLRGDLAQGGVFQVIDLAGHQEVIAVGLLEATMAAWLGGTGDFPDGARVQLRFLDPVGGDAGPAAFLDPVTVEERAEVTLLRRREETLDVPAGTVALELSVQFMDELCCDEWGLADEVTLELSLKDTRACDAARLKAAGKLFKAALVCHAKAAKKEAAGGDVLLACLDKAADKFAKAFDKSTAKAAAKGDACTFLGEAGEASGVVLDGGDDLAADVLDGLDGADTQDRALRSKLLKLVGALGAKLANAEAAHIKKPDAAKLAKAYAKAVPSLVTKADKAIAKAQAKGVAYDGPDGEALAQAVEDAVAELTDLLH